MALSQPGGQCVAAWENGTRFFFFLSFLFSKELRFSGCRPAWGYLWGSVSPTSLPVALCGVVWLSELCQGLEPSCTVTSQFIRQERAG